MKNSDLTVETKPIEIRFSIIGSYMMDTKLEEFWYDSKANPLPKLKMTGKQHWTVQARRYVAWKGHVVASFIEALGKISPADARDCARNYAAVGQPLILNAQRARMDIVITWSGGTHGDPENIFGSIADALFYNDKELAGSFDFKDEQGDGRVDILLTISEQRTWKKQKKTPTQ
jgi:ribosomal protein S9